AWKADCSKCKKEAAVLPPNLQSRHLTNCWSCRLKWSSFSYGCRCCGSLRVGDSEAQLNSMLDGERSGGAVGKRIAKVSCRRNDETTCAFARGFGDVCQWRRLQATSN